MERTAQEMLAQAEKGVKTLVEKQDNQINDMQGRIDKLEAKEQRMLPGGRHVGGAATIADELQHSSSFDNFKSGNLDRFKIETKTLLAGTADGDPLVAPDRDMNIYRDRERQLTLRDLMSVVPTDSNLVEYTRETAFTNNADYQAAEGEEKPQSAIEFSLENEQVHTIAHHMDISRQVLDDSAQLAAYIDQRMIYGLQKKEETELLQGTEKIKGILSGGNHVLFNRYPAAGYTHIDVLLAAQTQLRLTENNPTAVVLNPVDWEAIQNLKDSEGNYLIGFPAGELNRRIWGMNVVVTTVMDEGSFLMGDFQQGAIIRDRQTASIEISRHNDDNFTRNIVTVLAEERLALTVVRPSAFVYGLFEEITTST